MRVRVLSLFFLLQGLYFPGAQGLAVSGQDPASATVSASTVVVVSIRTLRFGGWSADGSTGIETRKIEAVVRPKLVLKGEIATPIDQDVSVVLVQERHPGGIIWDGLSFWSYQTVREGTSLVVFSRKDGGDLQEILASPEIAQEIQENSPTVADIRFIVSMVGKSDDAQRDALFAYLQRSTARHGEFLGRYAAAVYPVENASRYRVSILDIVGNKLTDEGMRHFMAAVFKHVRASDAPSRIQMRFAAVILRVLAARGTDADSAADRLQVDVLENYVPWLMTMEPSRHGIADLLRRRERKRVVDRLAVLETDDRISPGVRDTASRLRNLLLR
ncbi:MAG: hypothetical protein ACE5IK_08825 [Acidobacteriota bacterium]